MKFNSVVVSEDFPLKAWETLRIRHPHSRTETRVQVGLGDKSRGVVTFPARSYLHYVGTNKESISLEGNERKLRRV